ncbi:YetF domain-containing protein [Geosporobacter ferrireducens]|uniref:YetF C-terminal domain-containing protein n=1 Tax=Geosporobacter ferrireducens TaxID=1424294 RepID=A0A1D8GKC2_9FIRM|nr:DUF421 domain-containing protein [Geosporobacter ferrireducens]AOT71366.1 hypothetical protein Gferi_18485 [Geosporobacter ferrireducens]
MLITLIRTLILYIVVLICMRLMGKGEVAEMQPFELVIMLMIAELAALPMGDTGIPLMNGIIAIIALVFAQVSISMINLKSEKVRSIICGKPSILIDHGQINEKELKRLRISLNDLVEQIRAKDYPSVADVEFAILETNGDLSIIPKANKRTVTLEDLHLIGSYEGLPISLVIDGHINKDNLKKARLDIDWLLDQLSSHGIDGPKDVLFAYVDATNHFYVQRKQQK